MSPFASPPPPPSDGTRRGGGGGGGGGGSHKSCIFTINFHHNMCAMNMICAPPPPPPPPPRIRYCPLYSSGSHIAKRNSSHIARISPIHCGVRPCSLRDPIDRRYLSQTLRYVCRKGSFRYHDSYICYG